MTTDNTTGKFLLAPLPYDMQALAPHISEETLLYHHDKHMAAYVNKLNELVGGTSPQLMPSGRLLEAVNTAFGDADSLRQNMTQAAVALFGSGWVWLAADDRGALSIVSKPNAGNPLTDGLHPLLAIDVWEHAYYIDYRNARADGVKALWQVIDWKAVGLRYDALTVK